MDKLVFVKLPLTHFFIAQSDKHYRENKLLALGEMVSQKLFTLHKHLTKILTVSVCLDSDSERVAQQFRWHVSAPEASKLGYIDLRFNIFRRSSVHSMHNNLSRKEFGGIKLQHVRSLYIPFTYGNLQQR